MAVADFFDVLKTRRTVRSYTNEGVSRQDIQDLIDSAVLAPTGMNAQPWAFTVVTSRELMGKLNAIVVEMLKGPEMQQLMASEGLRNAVNAPGFNIFYNAPALIAISGDPKAPSTAIDCQLAAENIFLAAHAKGLGTCYMGLLLMAGEIPGVRDLLKLPEGYKLQAAAIVGHPGQRPEGPPQRNPARIDWVA
jgi:nitroreductase